MQTSGGRLRVGTDLTTVSEVSESIARFGDRYVHRLYTEHEIASCSANGELLAAGLAARFAAKEATIKVLRPAGARPDWRSIEVRRHPDGWCDLNLTGLAAQLADQQGIDDFAVSLTHEGGTAGAVVVATVGAR